jgi:lysophospholipase L1-like esterase
MNLITKKILLFLLIIISLITVLLLCEFYLNQTHFIPNPTVIDFTNLKKNNSFKINSRLIYTYSNDNEYRNSLKPNDPNKKNIAFVGDSVTWSYGASDSATYPLIFEKLYNQSHPNKNVLVNNFGIPGYNFDQEYLLIKEKILPSYHPDIIIWNLNVNDLWESNYSCLFTPKDHQWIHISARQNIYYWYGLIKTYFPAFITRTKLFNFIWTQFTKKIAQNTNGAVNFTFGCSSKIYTDQTRKLMLSKLNYFINDLKYEAKKRDIQLIITIVPYQQYFNNQVDIDQISPDYFSLEKYLYSENSLNFIDFNKNIPQPKDNLNPANEYFLNNSQDTSEFGWRHPNQKMYDLMATNLENYVQKNHLF